MCTEMRINMNIHKVLQSSAIALTAMTVSCFNMPAMTVTQILAELIPFLIAHIPDIC